MVAINSAIEIDLTGQVCADSIGPKFFSGVGGQMDFIYGASMSNGGLPVIALPSTACLKDGSVISRITPMLKQGAGVITSRNHIHCVTTEFGMVDLYGRSIRERTHLLISIAHPDFREDLKKQAEEGLEKAKETIGEENVEKIVEVAKDKATEVASGLKDKFQK